MTLRMSANGRAALIAREGKRLNAYKDSRGILTIGVGHTSAAGPPKVVAGLTITDAECDEILARDLVQFEDAVNKALSRPVSQQSFDALVSLAFNIGVGAFAKSTVVKRINSGDLPSAAEAILLWNKPAEIRDRRRQEYEQFKAGLATAPPPAESGYPVLAFGSERKADVIELQRQMKAAGLYAGEVDGKYGKGTKAAVTELQRRRGLVQDGIAGRNTREALADLL